MSLKKPPKSQDKTRRYGTTGLFPKEVGKLLEKVTDQAIKKRGFVHTRVLTHWPEIIGEDIAGKCRPKDVKFPQGKRNNGTLILHVKGAHALELQHSEALMIQKISSYFGYAAISRIKLVQAG